MQHILGLARRCIEDYNMIAEGETIAVGVSGGKDSMVALAALAQLRRFYPKRFQLEAITLETGMPGMDFDAVAEYCESMDVPYTRVQVPVYQIVFEERREKNPCSLCAKMRRGSLNTALTERCIHKIALGHHYDDAIETLLMNLLFEGRIGCFQPVTYLDRTGVTQIRPLLYCHEDEIRRAMEDAKKYEAWDRERKAALDVRNEGERLAYEAEKALSEHKELDKDTKKRIKEDAAALRKAVQKTKPEEITTQQADDIRRLITNLRVSAEAILLKEQ